MNQENINLLKAAKKDLQRILSDFEDVYLSEEELSSSLDGTGTQFSKWYYGEGQFFNKFSSFLFLENFYNSFVDNYNSYFEKEKSPIQKKFFSDGVAKRKSKLDGIFKMTISSGERLLLSIDMFINNVERSRIIERATVSEKTSQNKESDSTKVVSKDLEITEGIGLDIENAKEVEELQQHVSENIELEVAETTVEKNTAEIDGGKDEENSIEDEMSPSELAKETTDNDSKDVQETAELEKTVNIELSKDEEAEVELSELRKMLQDDFDEKLKSLGDLDGD